MFKRQVWFVLGCVVVGLSGCANLRSIYRTPSGSTGVSVITDAKQRVIVHKSRTSLDIERSISKLLDPNNLENSKEILSRIKSNQALSDIMGRQNIVCAEPSPDVAQALSFALQVTADLSKAKPVSGGSEKEVNATLGAGISLAESVVQLGERLAVIQLLRDKMYRACEAYGNGAMTQEGYTLILARLDKTMASMLATEIAGGAFGRKLATAGGSAAAGGVDLKALNEAKAELASAIKTVNDKVNGSPVVAVTAGDVEKIDAAAKNLAKIELMAVRSSASSQALASEINADTKNGAEAVIAIHREFMNDSGVEPLIDACLTTLSLHNSDLAQPEDVAEGIAALKKVQANIKAKQDAIRLRLADQAGDWKMGTGDQPLITPQGAGQQPPAQVQTTQAREEDKAQLAASLAASIDAETEVKASIEALKKVRKVSFGDVCSDLLKGTKNNNIIVQLLDSKSKYLFRTNERLAIEASGKLQTAHIQAQAELLKAKLASIATAMKACNVSAALLKDADKKSEAAEVCIKASDEAMKAVQKMGLAKPVEIIKPVPVSKKIQEDTPPIASAARPKVVIKSGTMGK